MGGAKVAGSFKLTRYHVNGDNLFGTCDAGTLDDRDTNTTNAEDGNGRTGFYLRGVECCTDARCYCAANQRGTVERYFVVDFYHGRFVYQHFFAKGREIGKLSNAFAVNRNTRCISFGPLARSTVHA